MHVTFLFFFSKETNSHDFFMPKKLKTRWTLHLSNDCFNYHFFSLFVNWLHDLNFCNKSCMQLLYYSNNKTTNSFHYPITKHLIAGVNKSIMGSSSWHNKPYVLTERIFKSDTRFLTECGSVLPILDVLFGSFFFVFSFAQLLLYEYAISLSYSHIRNIQRLYSSQNSYLLSSKEIAWFTFLLF